jgi:hypothetical protein
VRRREGRSGQVDPITPDVWRCLLDLDDVALSTEAMRWCVDRGYSVLDLLRARVAHRRHGSPYFSQLRCPCPEHAGTGLRPVYFGARREEYAAAWRRRRAAASR